MAEERPAFLCYAKEWIAATRGLPLAARGAYWDLLCFAWLDGSVSADTEELRLQVGADKAEWKRLWPKLAPKWTERDGRLYNDRLEEVRAESAGFTDAKRRAGQKGGQASAEARRAKHGTAQPRSTPEADTEADTEAEDRSTHEALPKPASASASAVTDTPRVTGADDRYLSDPGELPTMRRSSGHAWTSRRGVSVPHFLHDELLKRLGGDEPALLAWYAATEAAWPPGVIGDDAPTFWRARFRESHGTTVKPSLRAVESPSPNRPELRDIRAQIEAEDAERALAEQERAARKAASGSQERRTDTRQGQEPRGAIISHPAASVAR